MIGKIFKAKIINSRPSNSIVSAAFIITIAGLTSRILGLFRDRFLASTFGAGDTLDAYYAAFRIPDLIYNLLILGALSAAFIPVFTGLISKNKKEEAWELASGILSLAIIFVSVLSLILAIFAPWIMKIVTPGFSGEKMEQVVLFSRIMFLSPLLLGISGIFGGILTSFKRFFIYSLAPIFYNLGIILGVLVLVRFMGPVGLAWGVILGAFLHMAVQWPTVKHTGFKYTVSLQKVFSDKHLYRVIRLMIPRTLGIAVNQISLLIITIFASLLGAGSLAIFSFAQNLQSVPLGLVGISFAIAVFPTLSALYAKEEKEKFIQNFSVVFRQILFFVIPLSVFMLVLRAQIVRVVLGSGKFDWEDTILTFQVLGVFVLSLFAQSLVPLLARTFYAMHDTKTPFYIAIITEIINLLTVFILIGRYQLLGLAAAFSIASVSQMLMLIFMLKFKLDKLDDKNILQSVIKISFAAVIAGFFIQGSKYLVAGFLATDTFLGIFLQLFVSGIIGAAAFCSVSYFIKLPEFFAFKESITRRILRGKREILEDTGEVSGI